MMNKIHQQRGFTLIELMIVVAIIGLLVSVALPSYEHYTNRARFSEVLLITAIYKTSIAIGADVGKFNDLDDIQEGELGIPNKIDVTATDIGVHVHDGVILAQWRNDGSALDGVTFTMTPRGIVPPIQWDLGGNCFDLGFC